MCLALRHPCQAASVAGKRARVSLVSGQIYWGLTCEESWGSLANRHCCQSAHDTEPKALR